MNYKKLLSSLLFTTIFFSTIVTIYYHQKYQKAKEANLQSTVYEVTRLLDDTRKEYQNFYSQIVSVAELLSHTQSFTDYLYFATGSQKSIVEEIWLSVATNQKWFSQIRFIDLEGQEQIRVTYDRTFGGHASDQLRNQSSQAYFNYAQTLVDEQIGSLGIELETRHHNALEQISPVLRIITPVSDGEFRKGFLILNVDVTYLASRVNKSSAQKINVEVLSSQGFYLASEYPHKLYGSLIKEREQHRFSLLQPDVWQEIKQEGQGHLILNEGVVAFSTLQVAHRNPIHLVVDLSQEQLYERWAHDRNDLIQEAFFVLITMLIFALPLTSMAMHYRKHSIESKLARAALDGMTAVMISDPEHKVLMVNQEFENLLGYSSKEAHSASAKHLLFAPEEVSKMLEIEHCLSTESVWEGEVNCFTKYQRPFTAILRIQAIRESVHSVSYYITSLVDISERKALEEKLRLLSERDSLTTLWNRRKFEAQLLQYAKMVERYPATPMGCLALIDIDYFKRINDEQGHDEGDRVICEVANILAKEVRNTDFVSRVGGEEFAVLMPHTSLVEAEVVLNRLRIAVDLQESIPVTISVGFSDLTADSTRTYKCADIALYESKSCGRNKVSMCSSVDDIA